MIGYDVYQIWTSKNLNDGTWVKGNAHFVTREYNKKDALEWKKHILNMTKKEDRKFLKVIIIKSDTN